jgi:hypothetical protein
MLWSDQEITWSFKDHPKIMPNPGGYALVVDPIMHGPMTRVKFSKVLIDNGSSINIMYRHTMHTHGITENMLQPTHTTFHRIVPGLHDLLSIHAWLDIKHARVKRGPPPLPTCLRGKLEQAGLLNNALYLGYRAL